MKIKTLVSAMLALSLVTGSSAFAQRGDRDDHGRKEFRGNGHDNRGFGRGHEEERQRGRGFGPNYEYYRGDRLPVEYRHRNYVVDDWRGHQLSAPPRGYQWIQSNGDYLLVAIATGIILQTLLRN